MDGFTPTCDKIARSASSAQSSIGRASSATDKFSASLSTSESAAGRLVSRIGGLVAAAVSLATAQKVMDISDAYVNTSSRLSLITNSLTEQKQLQNDIFTAAYRSRGAYASMADTVAKLGVIAGQQFGGNQNIVKFAETMQKMFKVGGTSTAEQSGAMLQLQQAIGLGRLQGQDLRILAEDAPLVEKAIAKYMGKSVGDVRQLGTEGKITSDVLINSVLAYSSTVDKQFSKMPMTFGDVWNRMKTGATQAFGTVFDKLSSNLNSPGTTLFINAMIGGFVLAAQAANNLFGAIGSISQFFSQNWAGISPIIMGIVAALLIYNGVAAVTAVMNGIAALSEGVHAAALAIQTGATFSATAAQWGLNAALLACPLGWIILAIMAVILVIYLAVAAINHFAGTTISATGIILGVIMEAVAVVDNIFIGAWNLLIGIVASIYNQIQSLAEFFANVWVDPVNSAIRLLISFGDTTLGIIEAVDKAIDSLSGGILNLAGPVQSLRNQLSSLSPKMTSKDIKLPKMDASKLQVKPFDYQSTWTTSYKLGQSIDKGISDPLSALKNLSNLATKSLPGLGNSNIGTNSNPVTVKGTGSGGSVTVNIADQDLQYLRDLAEKQYVNKFSTAVLSPKMSFQYTGAAGNQSDMKKIYKAMGKMMQDELATAADGWYDN